MILAVANKIIFFHKESAGLVLKIQKELTQQGLIVSVKIKNNFITLKSLFVNLFQVTVS